MGVFLGSEGGPSLKEPEREAGPPHLLPAPPLGGGKTLGLYLQDLPSFLLTTENK